MGKKRFQTCVYMAKKTKDKLLQLYLQLKDFYYLSKWCLLTKPLDPYLFPMKDTHFVKGLGWDLTNNNHWSTLQTWKDFVEKILQPYRIAQAETLGLQDEQQLIWLIDY